MVTSDVGVCHLKAWWVVGRDHQDKSELGHHQFKPNQTTHVTAAHYVPFRSRFVVIVPITGTLRPFPANTGHQAEAVEKWTRRGPSRVCWR